jgi:hypothetical protein
VPGLFLPQDEAALEALLPTAAAVAALIAAFHSVEAAVRLANLRADAATVPRAPPAPLRRSLLVQAVASAARVLGASRGRLLLLHPPSQQLQPWLDVAAAGTVAPGDVDDEQPELDTVQYTVMPAAAAGTVQSSVSINWDDPHSLCLPLMTPLGGAPFGVLQFGGRAPSQGASHLLLQQSFDSADGSAAAAAAGYDRFVTGNTAAGGRLQYTQQQQPYFSAEDAELARVFAPHVASLLLGTRGTANRANSASFAQYSLHDARSGAPATAGESLTALAVRERCADSIAAVWPALAAALTSADTLQQACNALCTAVRSTVPCSRARAYLPWTDSNSSGSTNGSSGTATMLVAEVPSGARYSVQCATSSTAAAGDHGDADSDDDSTDSDSSSGGLLLAAVHTGLPQYATGGAATHNDCEDGFGEAGMWEIAVLPLITPVTSTTSSTTATVSVASEKQKHSSRLGRPQHAGHRSAVAAGAAQALQQTERSSSSNTSAVAGLLHVGRAEGGAAFSATEVSISYMSCSIAVYNLACAVLQCALSSSAA